MVGSESERDDEVGSARYVNIDYIKGNLFRSVRPDGAIGGITPQGGIQVAFFSERQAIPQRMVHILNEDGTLGKITERVGRDAVVRELDVLVTLDHETAASLVSFLVEQLRQLKLPEVEEGSGEET